MEILIFVLTYYFLILGEKLDTKIKKSPGIIISFTDDTNTLTDSIIIANQVFVYQHFLQSKVYNIVYKYISKSKNQYRYTNNA
jgi:hypothetical protein